MSFIDGKAIALATSHTLNINPRILTDRTKDDGDAPVGDADGYDWSVSVNSVVGKNDKVSNEQTIVDLLDSMLALRKVGIVTDAAKPATGKVPEAGWSPANDSTSFPASSGEAYIESLSITAGESGYATASANFKGQGELS